MPTTYTFTPDTSSGTSDGSTLVAAGTTMKIGDATAARFGQLRFLTTSVTPITPADTVVAATLAVKVSAQGAVPINIDVYATQYGAAITTADYNVAASNLGLADGNTAGWVVKLKTIIGTTAIANDWGTITIPSRFINKDSAVNAGFSDFELRTGTGFTLGSTHFTTLFGPVAVSGANSPQLVVITLTEAELLAQNSYRSQGIGAETYVAFDQETDAGVPVKGRIMLDMRSSSLDSYAVNIKSQSLSRQRARPRKIAPGRSGAGGDITFELTPEKWDQLLPGILKRTSTTGSGTYTHTFKVAASNEIKTFTFVEKKGSLRYVYPGAMINQLTLSCRLDEAVLATVSVEARDGWIYDATAAGDNDEYVLSGTASYDTVDNSILVFTGAAVTFDSVTDRGLVQDVTISMKDNVQERRGLNRQRSVGSHFVLGFEVDISFMMYFENEVQLRAFFGNNNTDFPFKADKHIEFQQVQFDFAGALGTALQNYSILVPKMLFETVRVPINSEGAIMLNCNGVAAYDDISTLTNIQLTAVNSEASSVFSASTDYITVQPAPVLI